MDFLLAADWDSEGYYAALDRAELGDWPELRVLADHPETGVRRALVSTLPLIFPDPPDLVVDTVIELTVDPASSVRGHAVFVLAQQWRGVDTPALRAALAERLDDLDRNTRSEALVGLAFRRDPQVVPRVRAALSRDSGAVGRLEMVAAGALGDSRLHPFVLRHLDGWDEADSHTVDAVRRLTDPAGPGSDLFRGVAELYRKAALDRPNPQSVKAWRLMDEMLDIAPRRAQEFFDAVLSRLAGDEAAADRLRKESALSSMLEPPVDSRDDSAAPGR